MKHASAGTAPLRNGSGLATTRAVRTGLRTEEAAFLSKLRLGAPAAVETLFDRYHGKVYGLAMSILMNINDAEEAAQDVFLTVVRKTDRFRENSALSSWIYRICVNTCLMRLRKGRRTETVPIDDFLPVFTEEGAHARPVEDWSRQVERRIPEKKIGQMIGRFTATLPEKYLVVFALRDVQGFSYEETAQVLDLTIAEVKSRLHRVRLYLRERLSRYMRDENSIFEKASPVRRAASETGGCG
jgi:RNA polymerase sigma-70 factor, ECF subfamily